MEILKIETRNEWLQERKNGIGASESAVLFGCQGYANQSLFALWASKCGAFDEEPQQESIAHSAGHYLEPSIAAWYRDQTEFEVIDPGPFTIVKSGAEPRAFCTPDRLAIDNEGQTGLLQIKAVGGEKSREWYGGIPLYVQVQVQQELFCTGAEWLDLAVFFGGPSLRFTIYHVEPHRAFHAKLQSVIRDFWELVETRTIPEIDGSAATFDALDSYFRGRDGEVVNLPGEFDVIDIERQRLASEISAATKRKKQIDAQLRKALGNAEYGLLDGVPLYRLSISDNGKGRRLYRLGASDADEEDE